LASFNNVRLYCFLATVLLSVRSYVHVAGLQLFIILLYFIGGLRVTGAGYFFANWSAIVLVSDSTRSHQPPGDLLAATLNLSAEFSNGAS
jgi:hypothetical protein